MQNGRSGRRSKETKQDQRDDGASPSVESPPSATSDPYAAHDHRQVDQKWDGVNQAKGDAANADGNGIQRDFGNPVGVEWQQPTSQSPIPTAHILAKQDHGGAVGLAWPEPGGVPEPEQPENRRQHSGDPKREPVSLRQRLAHQSASRAR